MTKFTRPKGHYFYPPGRLIAQAFQELSVFFDDMASPTEPVCALTGDPTHEVHEGNCVTCYVAIPTIATKDVAIEGCEDCGATKPIGCVCWMKETEKVCDEE